MAIANYVATATPEAGGEQVTGYVVYDGTATKAYIIPSTATIAVAEGTGVATITPASPTDIVEVTPDTVKITGNIQSAKTITELTANSGTITPDEGYDGLASVTIQAVKLQNVTATSTLSASAGSTPLNKTDATAWGIGTVTVNNIVTEEASFTPNDAGKEVVPTTGQVLSKVTVAPVPIAGGNSATPSLVQQTPTASGGYWKSFTVNATPLQDGGTIAPTESEQNAPSLTGGNIGYSTFKVGAIQTETATVKSGASETVENPSEGHYFSSVTVQALNLQEKTVDAEEAEVDVEADSSYDGLSKVTINPIKTESKSITATKEEQVVSPTSGKYLKSVTVSGYTLNLHEVEVDELTVGQVITTEPQYDGISRVTINGVKLEEKSFTPDRTGSTIQKSDSTAWGLSSVTVNPVPVENKTVQATKEDQTVTAEPDSFMTEVEVEGYVPVLDMSLEITPSDREQTVSVPAGYDGFGQVVVKETPLDEAITVDPSETEQVKTPTGLGFKGVTVTPIQIDSTNNSAIPTGEEQVKNPTEGTYFKEFTIAQTPLDEAITVQSGTETAEHTPETLGYKGVTVTGDANLIPGNIRKSISILGVKGTYLAPEAGTNENGFAVDEWVELDLPDSITKSEAFKATPFFNNHYLGKTFDGGDYMSVAIFTRYGRIASTVYLNDILGKFYLERTEIDNPFPLKDGKIVLFEDASSLEIDWTSVEVVFGNNHAITVDEPIEVQSEISFDSVVFKKEDLVAETPFIGTPAYFSHCVFEGFETIQLNDQNFSFQDCKFISTETGDEYQLDCNNSVVFVERTSFEGVNGIRVNEGEVLFRANTFLNTGISIYIAENATNVQIEGNIFNGEGKQLVLAEGVNKDSLYIIGDLEIVQ